MPAAPTALKSPEAFRTIGEVAIELEVEQHVLRFWETRFGQIRPVKRAGGRRYYRPEDVDLLRGIRSLLYSDGYTIKGVQKILREQGFRRVAEAGRNGRNPNPANARRAETAGKPPARRQATAPLGETESALPSTKSDVAFDRGANAKMERLLTDLLHLKKRLLAARESISA